MLNVHNILPCRLQSHFQGIQRISDSTTLPSVLAHLKASLFAQVNLSGLTEKLMIGKGDPQTLSSREKMQLWQELKTLSMFIISWGRCFFQSHTLGQLMNGCFESLILGSILNLVESWKALSVNDSELGIAQPNYNQITSK